MPVFSYKGKTLAGTAVSGELKAKSRTELERLLRSNKILVSSIAKKPSQINFHIGTGIRKIDISRFTRQFATMIGAGLPMVQCLEILSQQTEVAQLRKVITDIKETVQGGTTLSEALSKHRKVFDDLYINMVDAGEVGGALDTILNRLASYKEKADALTRKVKGALVYPAVISVVAVGVVIIMLSVIVPVFVKMFAGLNAELPMPTKIVIGLSNIIRGYFLVFVVLLVLLIVGYKYFSRTPKGRLFFDKMRLRIPMIGDLIRKSAISRFSRTLGTLITSGVPILDALDITARTSGNQVIHDAIKKSVLSIAEGETITQPLKDSGVFPPMVIQMIGVGEKTGGLDEMLTKIGDFYDEEVDAAVASLTSIIEPVIIVFMGVVIGGILIAMYLPMFEIVTKIA
ncbi:MAG: type II secretion system F family protein [candidate division Zixibacteria bacterium]|nr:type II secretion system F family protein [candidate division Zixibacteria bacterium]